MHDLERCLLYSLGKKNERDNTQRSSELDRSFHGRKGGRSEVFLGALPLGASSVLVSTSSSRQSSASSPSHEAHVGDLRLARLSVGLLVNFNAIVRRNALRRLTPQHP